jgi:hypothetical protein
MYVISLNSKGVSRDIINAVDLLYAQTNENEDSYDNNNYNPVSELITPEWHYSDSFQILNNNINTQINWDSLGRESGLMKTMVDSLKKATNLDAIVGTEFERSFCSWYQPYHYLPRQKWGVHLRYDSWMRVAALFYHNCPSTMERKLDSVKSAFLYLYVHELFHNSVENAASIMEILLRKPHIYTKYYSDVYSNVFNSSDCIEEALSNGYLFLWAEECCHIDRGFLKDELLKQGPGYHDFIQYSGGGGFSDLSKGNRILLSQIRHGDLNPTTTISYDPIEQLVDISDPIQYSSIYNVPIWLHRKPKPVHQKDAA